LSELRWDPLKMSWVIIANERGRRPRDFILERETVHLAACPFCAGNEAKTPGELFAVRPGGGPANGPGWKVRVIPNKYPILRIEGQLDKKGVGHYDTINGIGAHEVIIETPDHDRHLADLSAAEITDVLRAYRSRMLDLRRDGRFRYLLIFKNHGLEAGANVPHSHSQLLAVPVTPTVVATKLSVCREYYERKERCLICDLTDQEVADGRGVVRDDGHFVVFAPFASCHPFELRIVPRRHCHDFGLLDDGALALLAETLKDTLLRLRAVLRDPAYNFVLHNAPPMHPRLGKPDYWSSLPYDYHWHIELVPHLIRPAGFERGTGFYMNPAPPEAAARFLREADLSVSR